MSKYPHMDETIRIAEEISRDLGPTFYAEVRRLLDSGAVDKNNHYRGAIFAVALENMANNFMRSQMGAAFREYENLQKF